MAQAELKCGTLRYYVSTEPGASGFPEPSTAKLPFAVTADGKLAVRKNDTTTPFIDVPITQVEPRNDKSFDVVCAENNFCISLSLRSKDDTVDSWLNAFKDAGLLVTDKPSGERQYFNKKKGTKSLKESARRHLDSSNGGSANSSPRTRHMKRRSESKSPREPSRERVNNSNIPTIPENDKALPEKKPVSDVLVDEPETESSSDDEERKMSVPKPTDVVVEDVPKQSQSKLAKLMLKHGASATDLSVKTSPSDSARTVFSLQVKVSEAKGFSKGEKADSFCVLNVDSSKRRTRTIAKSDNPLWADEFTLELQDPETSTLRVSMWDDKKEDALFAKADIPLNNLTLGAKVEKWFPLSYGLASAYVSGDLHVRLDRSGERRGIIVATVVEGRNLAVPSRAELYVKLQYGKQQHRTKTCTVKTNTDKKLPYPVQQDPDWNEMFELLPDEDADGYVFSVYRKTNYMTSAACIGVASLMNMIHLFDEDKYIDRWVVLEPDPEALAKEKAKEKAKEGDNRGEVRLSLKLDKTVLYPMDYYNTFVNFVMEENGSNLVEILEKTSTGPEARNNVAYTLVRIYEARNQAPVVLKTLVSHEVASAPDVETLFRANSLGSKAIDMYMRLIAFRYLQSVVYEAVDILYNTKKSAEVDPMRMEKGDDPKKNLKFLMNVLNQVLDKLYQSIDECPTSLRVIFQHVQQEVVKKFPDDPVVRYTGVSGFMFLRFICAAILGPKLFDLKADHPGPLALRNLTIVAKTLQRIANMVPTTPQEGELGQVEAFIEEQKPKMQAFLDKLCEPDVSLAIFDPAAVDLANELSNLQDALDKQLDNIVGVMLNKEHARASRNAERLLEILDEMNDRKIEKKRLPVFVKNKTTGERKLAPAYAQVQHDRAAALEERQKQISLLQSQVSPREPENVAPPSPVLKLMNLSAEDDKTAVRERSKSNVGTKKKKTHHATPSTLSRAASTAPSTPTSRDLTSTSSVDESLSVSEEKPERTSPRKLRRTPSERSSKASALSPRPTSHKSLSGESDVDSPRGQTQDDPFLSRRKRSLSKMDLKSSTKGV